MGCSCARTSTRSTVLHNAADAQSAQSIVLSSCIVCSTFLRGWLWSSHTDDVSSRYLQVVLLQIFFFSFFEVINMQCRTLNSSINLCHVEGWYFFCGLSYSWSLVLEFLHCCILFFSCDHPAQVLVWVQRVNTLQKICGLSKAYGDWCLKLSAILLTC